MAGHYPRPFVESATRGLTVLATLSLLGGCMGFGGRSGPGRIPGDVTSAGYSSLLAQDVAACVAGAVGAASSQGQGAYLVVGRGVSYSIETTTDAGSYPTQVFVRGQNTDDRQVADVARCMAGIPVG